jgi:DNA segregation ATPase FtsK/SpoIIIE-like protein
VSDAEVEAVVTHLKAQGYPQYLEEVTAAATRTRTAIPARP